LQTVCEVYTYLIVYALCRYEFSEWKQSRDVIDVVIGDIINDGLHPGTEAELSLKLIGCGRASVILTNYALLLLHINT